MNRAGWCALFLVVLASRLAHSSVLWVEESYPAAAAVQILHGLVPYRDFVFDKPPLSPLVYLLWGALDGVPGRVAGAIYVTVCAWLASRFARDAYGVRESAAAAILMAFSLTFYLPAAVMALAPDLLMVAPHLAAVHAAFVGRPRLAGALAGVSLLLHTKGLFVLLACLLWGGARNVLLGFAGVAGAGHLALAAAGSLGPYWEQVWRWGAGYAATSHLASPLTDALSRVANWLGFHAALATTTAVCLAREGRRARLILWLTVSLAAVALGWRFMPRYFFQLLPVFVVCASRGFLLLPRRRAAAAALLLLIPFLRFGPRYFLIDSRWPDTAMSRDAAAAASAVRSRSRPGDTILVWGYRPEILHLTRLRLGTPWLDSQSLTGVLADRHLSDSRPSFGALAAANRRRLSAMQPDFVVDGLGLYNPRLAIQAYPDLADWLGGYRETHRTAGAIILERVSR